MDVKSKHCVNFQVLFKVWGMNVTPHETEEISISTTKALKMAAKWSILNSITKSKRMIPENETNLVAGFLTIPVMRIIAANSLEKLQSLKITQV